jgi:short-subunit dehydrogenase
MSEFFSKRIVITGASSGIGKALALYFSSCKSKLALCARDLEALQQVKKECLLHGAVQVEIFTCDVAIQKQCETFIEFAAQNLQGIDILINNAGISMRSVFNDLKPEVVEKVMAVNFFGTVYCTHAALPYLLQSKGSVVGISSIAGIVGLPARTGYSASKFAMHGFLESLRSENLQKGLHVLIACPGFTSSNIRLKALNGVGMQQGESPREETKMMQAEEVASRIAKAIKKRQNFLVLTFQGKLTYFLSKFFPSLLVKLTYNHFKKEPNSGL